jgi:predicted short-subunit dehydrogenase-like oxidoreductase (DUF2520 family)
LPFFYIFTHAIYVGQNFFQRVNFNKGITIIGTGNVAWHLAVAFKNAKVGINKIVGRDIEKARELGEYISCPYSTNIMAIPDETEIVLICVSDTAIESVIEQLQYIHVPVAHTAASVPLSVFGDNPSAGVFYPFQTFTRNIRMGQLEIPICLEANSPQVYHLLETLAACISKSIVSMSSEERKLLHIAGILVNNFPNYFYMQSFNFLAENKIDSKLLLPLIQETVQKLNFGNPSDLQTGPARRGSTDIVHKHIHEIKDNELRELYSYLSKSIMAYYGHTQ